VPLTGEAGYFWFFGEANVEALVKMVDGCAAGGRFWFFGAGLTNVDVTVAVADTWTGRVRNYRNPLGTPFQPLQDTGAFDTCSAAPPSAAHLGAASAATAHLDLGAARAATARARPARPAARRVVAPPADKAHACVTGPETLCLLGGRFRVESEWRAPNGTRGRGRAVELTSDTGYFWFFAPGNVEAVVKVLDACPVNGRRWVFAAGLTNVRVVTRVTDTHTGAVKTYTNPQGRAFQPLQDTQAFGDCN
jgi:hypothetical protein